MAGEILDNQGKGEASWHWPAVHPEGRKFALIAAAVCAFTAFMAWETLAWPLGALTIFILAFFRDPQRVTPRDDRLVIAPADGLVTLINKVSPPVELTVDDGSGAPGLGVEPVTRISIFMSVFDVHINRAPISGTVRRVIYIPGKFLNADLDKASEENERQHILIDRGDGLAIGFTQIAGLIARRIVPFVKPGDILAAGQRVGLIRFGSRVDVYLPAGTEPKVILGQKIIAGETVLAELGQNGRIERGQSVTGEEEPDRKGRLPGGLTLRAMAPNAITAAALCVGLTGIRFAIAGEFEKSVLAVLLAGMLDGIDGRIARLLKAQSRFGAELDSLADAISFGVAPALIIYLWTLQNLPRLGWFAALAFALCCVLRLARFNARIDLADEPRKQAGFLTGVPAPVGAGLAFLPIYLWVITGSEIFAAPIAVSIWLVAVAFLMISSVPTLSWGKLRPRRSIRLEVLVLAGLLVAALLTEPWFTLAGITIAYLVMIPLGMIGYARVRRRRDAVPAGGPDGNAGGGPASG